jgi:O-antigen/teichoic acid export membrane protein
MFLARIMGAAEFGIYIYAFTWLAFFTLVAISGMDTCSVRFIAAYGGTHEWGRLWRFLRFSRAQVLTISFAIAAAAAVLILLFQGRLGVAKTAVFLLACAFLPLNSLVQLTGARLQGLKQVVRSYVWLGIVRPLLVLVGVAMLHWALQTPATAVPVMLINVCVAGTVLTTMAWTTRKLLPAKTESSADGALETEWRKVSWSLFGVSGAQFLLSQADVLIIGFFLGTTAAGIYAVASRLASLVTFGITSVNSILAPTISDLYARKELAELQETVTLTSWGVIAYTVPVIVLLAATGKRLLGFFGPSFVEGYPVLLLLALGQSVVAFAGSVGFLLTMTGHQRDALRVIASTSALAILLILLLTPVLGVVGAAVGTMLATGLRSLLLSWFVRKRLNISATALRF